MPEWKKTGNYKSVEDVLTKRTGLTLDEIVNPKAASAWNIENMQQAADTIREYAVNKGVPVIIVGDYDADGVTATAILLKLFKFFGVQAKAIIPKRFTDGYGLSKGLIAGIKNALIITVDNGIAANEAVDAAKAAGNTVVILDHHLPLNEIPKADVVVDPHIHPEKNEFEHYCGAGLALKLTQIMLANSIGEDTASLLSDALVLACIGTIADVMPLIGDNRRIVKDGLYLINQEPKGSKISAGLRALLNLADRPYTEDTVKFTLGPIINSAGRLYNAGSTSTLKALICEDSEDAYVYANKMRELNEERKSLVSHWQQEGEQVFESLSEKKLPIVYLPGVPEGIAGIIAGKLADNYKKPVFVLGDIESKIGVLRGSGRSCGQFDISGVLTAAAGLLEAGGGHTGAAGISIRKENLDAFIQTVDRYMEGQQLEEADDTLYYDLEVKEADLPNVLERLKKYAPFGEGIKKPVLVVKDYQLIYKYNAPYKLMGKSREHLKLYGDTADAVAFGKAKEFEAMGFPGKLDLMGDIGENTFNGNTTLQFLVAAMRTAS